MVKNGHITLIGEIRGLKPQRRVDDPQEVDLRQGLVWVNTTEKALRWFDGTDTHTLAHGGNLDEYLNLAGGTLTGPLTLAADAEEALQPTSLQQVTELLTHKQDNIEGAASSVLQSNLAGNRITVSDEQGKLAASEVSSAQLQHLTGVTSNIQEQVDSKQANIGYVPVNQAGDTMQGDLQFDGSHTVTGLRAPSQPTDVVRLIDIDNLKADLDFQADVIAIQTDGTLEVQEDYGMDDSAVRIIVTDVATLHESFGVIEGLENNDIIVKNGEVFELAYDVSDAGPGVLTWARDLERFMKFNGTVWNEHGGLSGVTATGGLSKEGNTIRVETGAGIKLLPTGYVGLSIEEGSALTLVDPETGEASTEANAVIDLIHDASLSVTEGQLRVAAAGVGASHLGASVVGNGLTGAEGNALSIKLQDQSLVVDEEGLRVGDLRDVYLSLEHGGAIAGPMTVQAPTASANPSTKKYVDDTRVSINQAIAALTTRFSSSLVVYNGLEDVAQGTYVIDHNLGNRAVIVSVYDENYQQIVPDSIELVSADRISIGLAVPQRVYVVLHGVRSGVDPVPSVVSSVSLPQGGDITLAVDETYKFSVQYAGEGVEILEMDINVTDPATPELARTQYNLRADVSDPYDGAAADFAAQGVTVVYNPQAKRWDIDFGAAITEALVNSGQVRLFSALRDATGTLLWGDMNQTTPEMRVAVNLTRA